MLSYVCLYFSLAKPNKVYDAANDCVQGISNESGVKWHSWMSHRTVTSDRLRKTQLDLKQVLAADGCCNASWAD